MQPYSVPRSPFASRVRIAVDYKHLDAEIVRYCDDCEADGRFLGDRSDVLDVHGGAESVGFAPADLRITRGREHLSRVRLTAKGGFRWLTACCRTPFGNTAVATGIPMASVVHAMRGGAAGHGRSLGAMALLLRTRLKGQPLILGVVERDALHPSCGPKP